MKYRVFGITSLCEGSPFKFEGSEHIFMYDFDDIPEQWVLEEALRLHYKWGIDVYVLKSSGTTPAPVTGATPIDFAEDSLVLCRLNRTQHEEVR